MLKTCVVRVVVDGRGEAQAVSQDVVTLVEAVFSASSPSDEHFLLHTAHNYQCAKKNGY